MSSQSRQSSSSCRASRAVLLDNVDTAKMHEPVELSRVVSSRAKWNLGYTARSATGHKSDLWRAKRDTWDDGFVGARGRANRQFYYSSVIGVRVRENNGDLSLSCFALSKHSAEKFIERTPKVILDGVQLPRVVIVPVAYFGRQWRIQREGGGASPPPRLAQNVFQNAAFPV